MAAAAACVTFSWALQTALCLFNLQSLSNSQIRKVWLWINTIALPFRILCPTVKTICANGPGNTAPNSLGSKFPAHRTLPAQASSTQPTGFLIASPSSDQSVSPKLTTMWQSMVV
jgi:hypothetical protein